MPPRSPPIIDNLPLYNPLIVINGDISRAPPLMAFVFRAFAVHLLDAQAFALELADALLAVTFDFLGELD